LREYIDTRLIAMEQASALSRQTLEQRLASLNEIRDALWDRDATFITKVQFTEVLARLEGCIDALEADVRSLRESRSLLEGKASQSSVNIAYVIAMVAILLSVVGLIMSIVMK